MTLIRNEAGDDDFGPDVVVQVSHYRNWEVAPYKREHFRNLAAALSAYRLFAA